MDEAGDTDTEPRAGAPWRGRPRVPDPRGAFIAVRCNEAERAAIGANAARAGLSIGAFLRKLGTGSAGPRSRRQPCADRAELGRILAGVGSIGGNCHQLARAYNFRGELPPDLVAIRADVAEMRAALMKAIGRGD